MRWIAVGFLIACSSCRPPQETTPAAGKTAEPATRPTTESAPAPQASLKEASIPATKTPTAAAPVPAPVTAAPVAAAPVEPAAAQRAVSAAVDFPLVLMPHATVTDQARAKQDEDGPEITSITFSVAAAINEVAAFYENVLKQEKMEVQRVEDKKDGGEQVLLTGVSTTAQAMLLIERKSATSDTEVLATWTPTGGSATPAPAPQP